MRWQAMNNTFPEGTNLCAAIMHIYPPLQPERDFILQDDSNGRGPYIAQWKNADHEKPTYEQLTQALAELNANPTITPLALSDEDKKLLNMPAL
jgi:hypothetical protein